MQIIFRTRANGICIKQILEAEIRCQNENNAFNERKFSLVGCGNLI